MQLFLIFHVNIQKICECFNSKKMQNDYEIYEKYFFNYIQQWCNGGKMVVHVFNPNDKNT